MKVDDFEIDKRPYEQKISIKVLDDEISKLLSAETNAESGDKTKFAKAVLTKKQECIQAQSDYRAAALVIQFQSDDKYHDSSRDEVSARESFGKLKKIESELLDLYKQFRDA